MAPFSKILIAWYLRHKRELPWRDTTEPYLIWLSEIMLQQTRVAQGLPYYSAFTQAFPTVHDLAQADEQTVLKLWQGLGYYSRARNLHKTARHIAFERAGKFPDNYAGLLALKGIGNYTAAAIASFAYNQAVPVVDGNVFRVLSRYFDIETDIAKPAAKKEFAALAFDLMPKDNPAAFNQAIMEFGALQCVPKNPDCGVCPFNESCLALKLGKVNLLPVKSKKTKVKNRFLTYLVYEDEFGHTLIRKRTAKDIWLHLYEFPVVDSGSIPMVAEDIAMNCYGCESIATGPLASESVVHNLSHQRLHIGFVKIMVKGKIPGGTAIGELHTFPFPVVLHNFIGSHWK